MASMDVFKADAFSLIGMLKAIENVDYKPQFLGSLDLFSSEPQRTRTVQIESQDGVLRLIKTTPVGAPPVQQTRDKRAMRNFSTVRIAKGDTLQADEIQGIRAFGSETELMQVQSEVARRLQKLYDDLELTWELHRLGAVQGKVLDADGDTLVDYFTEFGVVQPTEVDFAFDTLAEGDVRPKIESEIVRPLIRAAKGAFVTGSRVQAIVGDDFWDALVNHDEVRKTYLNYQAAAELREATAFSSFRFAGVDWINYRGTDDGTTVAVAASEAKFFPVNAPGVFQVAWGPGEFLDVANQPGVPVRPLLLPDPTGRNAFVNIEIYSYPLYVCTRPLTLRRAKLST
ncbi:MAG: major capsid protein [Vicinamibacterales bacterium]